jgi:hypothetical protein
MVTLAYTDIFLQSPQGFCGQKERGSEGRLSGVRMDTGRTAGIFRATGVRREVGR